MRRVQQLGEKPTGLLCRRGEALRWLQIPETEFDKLEEARVIKGYSLRTGGRKFYRVDLLEEKILKIFDQKQGGSR